VPGRLGKPPAKLAQILARVPGSTGTGLGLTFPHVMKRRTFRRLRSVSGAEHHHNVYVVLLDGAVGRFRKVKAANPLRDPAKPSVYVGMSGLSPEERFENHRRGDKASSVVRRFGIRLLPELYAHLNPMPFEVAAEMEQDLAEDLRRLGYTVTGGH